MMRRTFIALALAAAFLGGCGGGDDDESAATATPEATQEEPAAAAGGETLALGAPEDGALVFDKSELEAPAGSVTIEFSNPSPVPHAVAIEGNGVNETGETVTESDAAPLTVELEAGEYTFYCPVGGHRAAGMEGTLTVN
jgi:plastocyanin